MNENNQKHIDILQTCVKQFDLKAAIREYDKSHLKIATIPIRFDEALAAMQVLQEEIYYRNEYYESKIDALNRILNSKDDEINQLREVHGETLKRAAQLVKLKRFITEEEFKNTILNIPAIELKNLTNPHSSNNPEK